MSRSFDSSAFDAALGDASLSIFQLARMALTPMFRMRRILRGSVPIGWRRTRIAAVLSAAIGGDPLTEDDLWPDA